MKRFTPGIPSQQLGIKRKYKSAENGSVKKWWFVIRGDEDLLDKLDNQWNEIATHTGWRLEPSYSFEEAVQHRPDTSIPPVQHLANNVEDTPTAAVNTTPPANQQDENIDNAWKYRVSNHLILFVSSCS